jgi:hypothetical protein
MTVISGEGGAVNGEAGVREWMIEDMNDPNETVASNTKFAVDQGCGVDDWTGQYVAYAHTGARFPGEKFTFTGNVDGTNGWSGAATCEALRVVADIENGRYLECTTMFASDGTLTPGAAAATDSAIPDPPCSRGLGASFAGAAIADVGYWEFILQCRTKQYVSGDTDGVRKRVAGPITGQFQIRCFLGSPASLPKRGDVGAVAFKVTDSGAGTSWVWNYGKIVRIVPTWRSEDRRPPYATIYGVFKPFSGTSAGSITNPAGAQKWPAAA